MNTWQQRNRDAFNALWRKWYAKNAAKKLAWQKRRRSEIRTWWHELKAMKRCERCGETASECLHFHHRDPNTKDLELAQAVANAWSKDRILEEVAKCDVLCANCHAKLHWDERWLSG
jgi:hypothetical protein